MAAPATPSALSGLLFPPDMQAARAAWLRRLFAQVPDEVTTSAARMEAQLQAQVWGDRSLGTDAHHLAVPALLVSGAADVVFPPADAGALAAAVPSVSIVTWPDAGYASVMQDAQVFVDRLERFTG
jgi:pimeloyl-ACP methyl ester carboxylesterase